MIDYILRVLLGWIVFFPMMQFLSARHMFMHCMFFCPSFLCLKVSILFLFSSLSLSFVLLIIAPKKAIPSKNLIRDETTQDDFSENFFD